MDIAIPKEQNGRRLREADNLLIPKKCCYMCFGKSEYDHSKDGFETIRGEQMIIDFDKKGKVMGIELLGYDKPCQTARNPKRVTSNKAG